MLSLASQGFKANAQPDLRAIHIIAGLAPHDGGPSYSVPRLRDAQVDAGCEASLFTVVEPAAAPLELAAEVFTHSFAATPILSNLRLSHGFYKALLARARSSDIIHNHGLWLMPNIIAGRVSAQTATPLVVSPRGMLAPAALGISSGRKRAFWKLLQGPAFANVAAWHATCEQEAAEIRDFGIRDPIAIIPNGGDLPEVTAQHADNKVGRTMLFLSRLHPKKNIPTLIEAWRRIAGDRPDWELLIVGPDERGHRRELEAQIVGANVPRARCLDPVYGADKRQFIADADLFVLPTKNENFGLVVAEALAAGVPAIVTKGAPWAGLQAEACGWWVDHGVEPLVAAMSEATDLTALARGEMGNRGRAWMARDYSWPAVAKQMIELYSWIGGRTDRPRFVH
jgi:glycosyltransferase involved in cell wall biosynthesis